MNMTNKSATRKTVFSGLSIQAQISSVAEAPIVYLLDNMDDHSSVQVPDNVSLVVIGVDQWEHRFSPWKASRVFAKGADFGDGAQDTFSTITEQIIPWAESSLPKPPAYRILVGYSLAGLFSLWSGLSQQNIAPNTFYASVPSTVNQKNKVIFQRIGAVSGSFWFPGLTDYVDKQLSSGEVNLACVYLSLGDREERTPNPQIMHVRKNAELIKQELQTAGITAIFELNRGNHFQNIDVRIQKAVEYLLK